MKSHQIIKIDNKEFLRKLNNNRFTTEQTETRSKILKKSNLKDQSYSIFPDDDSFNLDDYFQNKSSKIYEKLRIQIIKYKKIIQNLNEENEKLRKINEILMISISKKDEFILKSLKDNQLTMKQFQSTKSKYNVLRENLSRTGILAISKETFLNDKHKLDQSYSKSRNVFQEKLKKITLTQIDNEALKTKSLSPLRFMETKKNEKNTEEKERTHTQSVKFTSHFDFKDHSSSKKDHEKTSTIFFRPEFFYDKIADIGNRNAGNKKFGKDKSLLAIKEDYISKLQKLDIYKELYPITCNEELFASKLKSEKDEKLLIFGEQLNSVLKDYLDSLRLILRIKQFLKISMGVSSIVVLDSATQVLIKNTCEILNCERATIFVYEKVTNMLMVHSGEGLRKSELRVPFDKGIVGQVFCKGEKIKIDEAYLDERFNRDIDNKTNYHTKSILCLPLKNAGGKIFGVIQAINKKEGVFSADDEQLIEIFAIQASSTLCNSMDFDENQTLTARLQIMLELACEITNPELKKGDFTIIVENFFMRVWGLNEANFYYFNPENEKAIRKTKYEEKINELCGIIRHVVKTKELYGINTSNECSYYNPLIDIHTGFAIVTFPIKHRENNQVLGILQTPYPFKLELTSHRVKENDYILIEIFCKLAASWLEKN